MKNKIDFRRVVVQLLQFGFVAFTSAVTLALTGCGGGGGAGGATSAATPGAGRGSVIVRVPFAGSANSSRLQAAFPSTVNHVEIELFGGGATPTVAIGTHHDNVVTFSDVTPGEKYVLFLAVNDSNLVLLPGTFTGVGQRALRQAALTPSRIFSMALVGINVQPGPNTIDTVTIGGLSNSSAVFGPQRTVGATTGLEFNLTDITGTEHQLVVPDSTGLLEAGILNNAGTAFVETNSPISSAMFIPSPLGGFVGDFTHNQGNTPEENCHRVIALIGIESIALPGGTSNIFHFRTTDTCTPVGGGGTRKRIFDQWVRIAASASGTGLPVGPVLLAARRESSSNTTANLFSSDEVRVLTNANPSTSPLIGPLGSDLLIGPGTSWQFISAQTSHGASIVVGS